MAPALAAPALAQSPGVRWRLCTSYPRSLDIPTEAALGVARTVGEATGNAFHIQVFTADELLPAFAVLDAVGNATIEMCFTTSSYYWGKDPTFALGSTIPFGLNSRMQNAWLLDGGGLELMNSFYARYNVIGLPGGNTGAQMGGWFRREVASVADLRGLKMRIAGLAGTLLSRLGVIPQQIAAAEIYGALERGVIDAAEFVGPYEDERLGFEAIAPYYYYPGWWEGGTVLWFMVNLDSWNRLSDENRAILRSAIGTANSLTQARFDARNPPALERLVARGARLRPFARDILDACFVEAERLYAELSEQSADFRLIYDSLKAFRADQYLWLQLAEFSFDSYMIYQQRQGNLQP